MISFYRVYENRTSCSSLQEMRNLVMIAYTHIFISWMDIKRGLSES